MISACILMISRPSRKIGASTYLTPRCISLNVYDRRKPHLVEYMGTSRAREEYPYIVLRGGKVINIYRRKFLDRLFSHLGSC